ncbi:RNA polymerase sigma-70 factor [Sphingobacterium psychroaquaticum]|uniref:RNA polymerase sigma-70 factor, ECF subfamily n=1 Tax=Sphingobacterium psychroaquaticum TaxID=561061 RepID=A0A1X7I5I4_9SPHI|nr:RNA polymerase sigma-70 factor [Sphingobacterium psychroaquaticum]QBQ41951.1 RNA polymerase sigma-70 factor [Sphingobacterium psychroaquaticum]SMG09050.1 RNA polymerase sigma-70 factor, ECF subfamily [Sphingobacterium psychroaquaticum]
MSTEKEKKFEEVFRAHFKELHAYVYRILEDSALSEEVVQQVFLRLWEKDWESDIHTSLRAYLYKSVYHESLNIVKRNRVKQRYTDHQVHHGIQTVYADQSDAELKKLLHSALDSLPEKSRVVFEMSRFQELKYQEIAVSLNLSLKTVEGHMTKALRHLRIHLVDYLTVLLLTLISGL